MKHNILVSDPISTDGLQSLLNHSDFNVDIKTDLDEQSLLDIIGDYEGFNCS